MHNYETSVTQQHNYLTHSDVYCHSHSPFYLRGEEGGWSGARVTDLGELEHSQGNQFHHHFDALHLSKSSIYGNGIKPTTVQIISNNLHFDGLGNSMASTELGSPGGCVESGQLLLQKEGIFRFGGGNGPMGNDNWVDSGVVADHSGRTETSIDTDDKNQFLGSDNGRLIASYSPAQSKGGCIEDQKTLRRLAQNREAARKSRLRKKAYIQQLESSRQRLAQLEQDLKQGGPQGSLHTSGFPGDQIQVTAGNVLAGSAAFDIDYAQWLEEHQRLIHDMRSALNSSPVGDGELHPLVDSVMSHYDELFQLKSSAAKNDIFHVLSGMWKSPAERCFMWLGGFRSSDILKILGNQIEPLSEQQVVGICSLQQSSQQAEDALTQGMEALQQSLLEALSSKTFGSSNSDYVDQMSIALRKLAALENFLHQADVLRLQTLQQLQRILTTRQAAYALLAINDCKSRLRALSSLWLARPKE